MDKIDIYTVYKTLLKKYDPQGWWPVYSLRNTDGRDNKGYLIDSVYQEPSIFEISIGAILTQNTAWTNVEKAIDNLLNLNLLNVKTILEIDQDVLANAIRPSGYYNQKAKKIKILIKYLHNGNFFETGNIPGRNNLLELWGIGNETADSILLYAYNVPVFVVDTYTKRIFERLGVFDSSEKYEAVAGTFTNSLEQDTAIFQEYHALIVKHAKEFCKKKPLCEGCVLGDICRNNTILDKKVAEFKKLVRK